jgi:hypothetical protein
LKYKISIRYLPNIPELFIKLINKSEKTQKLIESLKKYKRNHSKSLMKI